MLLTDIHDAYLPVIVFGVIAAGLAVILVLLPFILNAMRPYSAKTSSYECGFEAFDHVRSKFDIRFYLVSLLFIVFDLEVVLIFPWAVSLKYIGLFGFLSAIVFLAVLTVGFIYEWRKGALDWE